MGLHEGQEGITTLHYSGNMHTQALGPREGQVLLDKNAATTAQEISTKDYTHTI
jgi:hypothetical protein